MVSFPPKIKNEQVNRKNIVGMRELEIFHQPDSGVPRALGAMETVKTKETQSLSSVSSPSGLGQHHPPN